MYVSYGMSGMMGSCIVALFITCICAQKKLSFLKRENQKHLYAKSLQATFEMECRSFIRDNMGPIIQQKIAKEERMAKERETYFDAFKSIPRQSIEDEVKRMQMMQSTIDPTYYNPLPSGFVLPPTPVEMEAMEGKRRMLEDPKTSKSKGWSFHLKKNRNKQPNDDTATLTTTVSDTLEYVSKLGRDM